MSLKLMFEIGHLAARKTKPSKEGFTHDWELFVRGSNEANDISHFVEKVVFNLHESFPKPKRVIKEPPYTVKEAGYAGFVLTIDIYLRNRDEPKKVTFEYDLDLQPSKAQMNEFIIATPSDEFKRKCLKGGGVLINSDYKGREPYNKNSQNPAVTDLKKMMAKRPEDPKPNKVFTDLFGAPLKKPDPRSLQNASPNPTKAQPVPTSKAAEKLPNPSSSKEKGEKSKHKHSPNKDGKESKKSSDNKSDPEKSKKDKKDRDRGEKKEKASKRPPSPNSMPQNPSTSARNSTNLNALPQSKIDSVKPPAKPSPAPPGDSSFNKKSSKKDKKSDKERDRNEKKETRSKESFSTKEKVQYDAAGKASSGSVKERDAIPSKDERDKAKVKANASTNPEPKTTPIDVLKKQHEKDAERKNKHKKKEKTKDKEVKDSKKEKQHKSSPIAPVPVKVKEPVAIKYEPAAKSHLSDKDSSDSDADSPPSIKQDSENSISDPIVHKPPEAEKTQKKPRERSKAADKEEKSHKRKSNKKDERDSSVSPPPMKQQKKDLSPSFNDRPTSSDSAALHAHANNNNNNVDGAGKGSNDYMSELKDLKHKITTLKSNEDLQQVVKLIAATGCYEITKSSFDFDLVQLDRGTVQRLQEFFAAS